jgi:hypothetical protein
MFCPHCGKEVSEHQVYCQFCGGKIADAAPGQSATGRERTAWEDRSRNGLMGGLLKTLKESLFNPSEFFKKLNVTGGLADPTLYALIVGMVGIMVFYFWQILLQNTLPGPLSHEVKGPAGIDLFSGIGMALVAVCMPFFIILGLFVWAGFLHVLLLLVQGAKNGFEATFRTVAYSYGSNIFLLIPFCGGIIAGVWNIVIVIIGLKEAHGTTGGKAAFAVLFPVIFCCAAALFFVLVILGAVAASFGTMSHEPWK